MAKDKVYKATDLKDPDVQIQMLTRDLVPLDEGAVARTILTVLTARAPFDHSRYRSLLPETRRNLNLLVKTIHMLCLLSPAIISLINDHELKQISCTYRTMTRVDSDLYDYATGGRQYIQTEEIDDVLNRDVERYCFEATLAQAIEKYRVDSYLAGPQTYFEPYERKAKTCGYVNKKKIDVLTPDPHKKARFFQNIHDYGYSMGHPGELTDAPEGEMSYYVCVTRPIPVKAWGSEDLVFWFVLAGIVTSYATALFGPTAMNNQYFTAAYISTACFSGAALAMGSLGLSLVFILLSQLIVEKTLVVDDYQPQQAQAPEIEKV